MDILLQGSGAADGIPALFSDSRVSRYAREHGGKDIRSRSAALVDGQLRIDFGPDTWHQLVRDRIDARDLTSIVFTHSHEDHLCLSELQYMLYSFTPELAAPLTIFANTSVISQIEARYPDFPFELIVTKSFEAVTFGDYTITPIAAYHKLDEDCHNLLIERDGKTLLYGTDTGYWREPTWEFLAGCHVDGLILECTDGRVVSGYHGHLSISGFVETIERLRTLGTLREGAPIVSTHHCHYGDATHEELVQQLEPHGVTVGFDGLRFSL